MNKLIHQMRNEWRSNIWLVIELLIVSVILWFCIDRIVDYIMVYNEPRGHDISHVYKITVGNTGANDSTRPSYEDMNELIERIRRRPEIEAAAYSYGSTPYNGILNGTWIYNNDTINPIHNTGNTIRRWVEPDFFKIYRISGVRGESPERLAEILRPGIKVFGASEGLLYDKEGNELNTVDYIGQQFNMNGYPDHTLAAVTPVMKRFDSDKLQWSARCCWDMMVPFATSQANELSVRVRANMDSPSFITDLMNDSESQLRVGPYFIMKVESMADLRRSTQMGWTINNRNYIIGAAFLLFNIFLGVLGSFWYRTRMRVPDIAVLKIFGATKGNIFLRLIGEGLLLLCIATPLAILCEWLLIHYNIIKLPAALGSYLNFDFIRLLAIIPAITFALLALMIIAGISFSALRAMKLAPALALHSE